jgi:hypothetical protein
MGRDRMSHCSVLAWYSLKFESVHPNYKWFCCVTEHLMFMTKGPLIIMYELKPTVLCFSFNFDSLVQGTGPCKLCILNSLKNFLELVYYTEICNLTSVYMTLPSEKFLWQWHNFAKLLKVFLETLFWYLFLYLCCFSSGFHGIRDSLLYQNTFLSWKQENSDKSGWAKNW